MFSYSGTQERVTCLARNIISKLKLCSLILLIDVLLPKLHFLCCCLNLCVCFYHRFVILFFIKPIIQKTKSDHILAANIIPYFLFSYTSFTWSGNKYLVFLICYPLSTTLPIYEANYRKLWRYAPPCPQPPLLAWPFLSKAGNTLFAIYYDYESVILPWVKSSPRTPWALILLVRLHVISPSPKYCEGCDCCLWIEYVE